MQPPRWQTDSLGGAANAGTQLENDCLSSPLQRVLLGSTHAAYIYLPLSERLLWFCSALSSLRGQVPTHTSTRRPMGAAWDLVKDGRFMSPQFSCTLGNLLHLVPRENSDIFTTLNCEIATLFRADDR